MVSPDHPCVLSPGIEEVTTTPAGRAGQHGNTGHSKSSQMQSEEKALPSGGESGRKAHSLE